MLYYILHLLLFIYFIIKLCINNVQKNKSRLLLVIHSRVYIPNPEAASTTNMNS